MAGKSERLAFSEFRQLFETGPRRRIMIKRRFVPELTTWLQVIAERVKRGLDAVENGAVPFLPPQAKAYVQWAKLALEVIGWIGNSLNDSMDQGEFATVAEKIKLAFGIKDGDPPPDEPVPLPEPDLGGEG